jgi:cobyric acid synthase
MTTLMIQGTTSDAGKNTVVRAIKAFGLYELLS